MKLNCDLGEGLELVDTTLMPIVDQASIACGGHAGDLASMSVCIQLAKKHATAIGAHPSYPDRKNFGRTSIDIDVSVLQASLRDQLASFLGVCQHEEIHPEYVKPHGALYNDLARKPGLLELLLEFVAEFNQQTGHSPMALMVNANLRNPNILSTAQKYSVELLFEAFADRAYTDSGDLLSRAEQNALYTSCEKILSQIESLSHAGGVYSVNGKWLQVQADSICVHGDNPAAVEALLTLKRENKTL